MIKDSYISKSKKKIQPVCTLILLLLIPAMAYTEPTSLSKSDSQSENWVLTEGTTPTAGARSALLINSTLLGLGIYGPTVLLEIDDSNEEMSRPPLLGYLLTVGGSYALPSLLYDDNEVTWAMTDLANSGFSRGLFHGSLINILLDGSSQNAFRLASLFSIAEGSLGLYFANKYKMNAGKTHTLTVSHDLGNLVAVSLLPAFLDSNLSSNTYTSLYLGLGGLGLLGGHFYSNQRSHSWGDAEMIRLSGLVGMNTILPILATADVDDLTLGSIFLLSGLVGGVTISDYFIKDLDFTPSEALVTDLLTVGGFFGGIALAYFIAPDSTDETYYLWGSALGALSAYSLRIYNKMNQSPHSSSNTANTKADGFTPTPVRAQIGPWFTPSQVKMGEINRGLSLTVQF